MTGGRGPDGEGTLRDRLRAAAAERLSDPVVRGRAVLTLILAMAAVGLLLPPVSLIARLTSIGYTTVRAGAQSTVRSTNDASILEIDRLVLRRSTRVRLRSFTLDDAPGQVADLPAGRAAVAGVELQVRGPRPQTAWVTIPAGITVDARPFIDPYAWDGHRWRWLAPDFPTEGSVRIELPLEKMDCRWIVVTKATSLTTELSVAVLPPPATIPAAVVDMPILELRAYHLSRDDGTIRGGRILSPARDARLYGIVDNLDMGRVRSDLLTNVLIRPDTRQRNAEAIADLTTHDGLDGIVLDYQGIPDDLQPVFLEFVRGLGEDLGSRGVELIVAVPMPRRAVTGWDPGPVSWTELGGAADALRVVLPVAEPIDAVALEDLAEWGLRHVERQRLQLAVPVQGRDSMDGSVSPISFGAALDHILDMARSDAPGRVSPGEARMIDLPTLAASGFGWDEAAMLWRFRYWDDNRREHTVWLNDAAGLSTAFQVAARYRLGRLVLDGVEAGLDPAVWDLARRFVASGDTDASRSGYMLEWRLTDAAGRTVQEALQPLGQSSFALRAPSAGGSYRLTVNLVNDSETVVALGDAAAVSVAPVPAATAKPTPLLIYLAPTPMPFATAPAPADEAVARRTPVRIEQGGATATPNPLGARLAVAQAELRAAPDLDADRLSDLRTGVELELIGRTASGDWLLVRIASTGVEGWVLAELVDYDAAPSLIPVVPVDTPLGGGAP